MTRMTSKGRMTPNGSSQRISIFHSELLFYFIFNFILKNIKRYTVFRMTRTIAQVKNYNKIEFEVEKVLVVVNKSIEMHVLVNS